MGANDPYSFSKTCSDLSGTLFQKLSNKTKIITLRCGNIIGGGDWNDTRIIPDIVKSIFEKKKLLIRNKNAIRPWLHIIEFLFILIKILTKTKLRDNKFNIGPYNKKNLKVHEIVKKFSLLSKVKNKIHYKKNKFSETPILKLNINRIKSQLQKILLLDINEKIKLTFNWYKIFYENKKNINKETMKNINLVLKKI